MEMLDNLKKTLYDDIFFINLGCIIYEKKPLHFRMYLKKRKYKRLKLKGLLFNVCPMLSLIFDHGGTSLYFRDNIIEFVEFVSTFYDGVVVEDPKLDLSDKDPNNLYGPIFACYLEYELNFIFEYIDDTMLINRNWCMTMFVKNDYKIDENNVPQDVITLFDLFKFRS